MDHRTVPVQAMRELARDRAELTSVRQVADEIGLGRTTLHNFISADTMPHPRVRRLLALWYLREKEKESASEEKTYAAAFEILVNSVPPESRDEWRVALATKLAELHAAPGAELPAWLDPFLRSQMKAPPDPS
jgi:uncharacterized Zn finger protein